MPAARPDRTRNAPGSSVWKSRGALHVVTMATVVIVLLVSVLNAIIDRAHTVSENRLGNAIISGLAVRETRHLLVAIDAAITDPGRQGLRADHEPSLRSLPAGVLTIRLLLAMRSGSAGLARPTEVTPSGKAMPWIEEQVVSGRVVTRAEVALDPDWLSRRYDELRAGSSVTIVLFDEHRRPVAEAGPDAAAAMRSWMDGEDHKPCLCDVTSLTGTSLTIVVGKPWLAALQPWYQATTRRALATSLIICILMALSVRVERIEGREAKRLAHLSDSIARLSQHFDQASLFRQVEVDATALLDSRLTCAVVAQGADCDGHRFELLTRDGTIENVLLVSSRKPRQLTRVERLSLEQLVYSASDALDVIRLLEQRRAEVETVTVLHRMALQSQAQIEAMFGAMPDAVLAVNQAWQPVFANREARVLLDLDAAGHIDASLWQLLPHPVLEQVEPALREAARTRSEQSRQVRWLGSATGDAPPTERWIALRGVGHPLGMTLSLQDISQQIETDNRIRQAAKMEAIGQLTGGIAHDFNNLLTVIMGNLELLEIDAGAAGDEAAAVSDALRAARGAADLTHQLLAFARKQPLAPRRVDVGLLLREMTGLLRTSVGPNISVTIAAGSPRCHALIDRPQLQNALINLAVNARDAMPEGGTLAIRVTEAVIALDNPILVEGLDPGDYVRIEVTDNGHGVPASDLPHVFEPFFTTKQVGAGTGLGLSMVYGFVKQSRGHATLSSVLEQGTTITLLLPHDAGCAANDAPAGEDPAPPLGHGETVLLVEDVDLVREQTARMLRRLRYVVIEAGSARGAMDAVACGAVPDLLLTDLGLPGGVNGHDLALRMRAVLPDLPVLFATGYADSEMLGERFIMPGTNLLLKPFTFLRLGSLVSDAMGVRRPVAVET